MVKPAREHGYVVGRYSILRFVPKQDVVISRLKLALCKVTHIQKESVVIDQESM
jgi:hypothetical protein